MRKDIYEGVRLYVNQQIKPNYAALARQYKADYRTVKTAYEKAKQTQNNLPNMTQKKIRKSKLDPFKELIEEKLILGCSAKAIFKFIEKKGFDGKYTIVREYCKQHKEEKVKKATIRVNHQPGLSAQVDWKEEMKLISSQGDIIKFNIFLYVLPYSKKKFITLTFDRKQDTLFQCLRDAFNYTGGVPEEIWFDNMKTVVDHSRTQFNNVQFNDRFYAFSKDAGFKPIACRPYRPQTKGSVEALARTMDRLCVYNYEFQSIPDLINLVSEFCEELNQEVSQATGKIPDDLWLKTEKEHLSLVTETLLTPYFETDIRRIVSKESMVQFRKNKYSVNPKYIGYEVILKVSDTNDHVKIYHNDEEISAHILTEEFFNYHKEDMKKVLQSDVFKHKTDDDIEAYIEQSLSQYDVL